MLGQRVRLEWNMGDASDDIAFSTQAAWRAVEWEAAERSDSPWPSVAETHSWQMAQPAFQAKAEVWHPLRAAGLFLLALLLISSTASTPELDLRMLTREGIEAALELERSAWQADDKALYNTLVDDEIELRWINEWRDLWRLDVDHRQDYGAVLTSIEPLNSIVEANVTIVRPSVDWWRASPYMERRFYRQEANRWVRTLPDESFWGTERTLETEYMLFTFTERDSQTVTSIVAEVERIYVESRLLFELTPPSTTQKLHITITPDMIRRWYYNRNQVLITSPVVSKVPVGLSEADYLAQTLADLLTYRAIENASVNNQSNFYRWGMMIWGLSGWLRSELVGEKSPWDRQANRHFHQLVTLPLQLEAVTDWQGDEPPTRERLMAQYMAAESIVDYIVATYGRKQLPILLNALSEYLQWDSLIQEVFDTSRAEFENGWNQHIKQHY